MFQRHIQKKETNGFRQPNFFHLYDNKKFSLQTYTEQELVKGLKAHDNGAYRYLYLHYRQALFTAVLQIVPDTEIAGDVLQEAFVSVWKGIEKYDAEKGRLFTWLLTLARNTAINTVRSKGYKASLKNADVSDYVFSIEAKQSTETPVNFIGLRTQVHQLKEEYKTVLELAYFNGYTQQEIADALHIPVGTVKTRLRNAIIELRKQFV
jgi:RNA polymerase sigma factor (sigma-70 family)